MQCSRSPVAFTAAVLLVLMQISAVVTSKECKMPDKVSGVEERYSLVEGNEMEVRETKWTVNYPQKMMIHEYKNSKSQMVKLFQDYKLHTAYLSIDGVCEQYAMPIRRFMQYSSWMCGWKPKCPEPENMFLAQSTYIGTQYAKTKVVYYTRDKMYRSRLTGLVTEATIVMSLTPIDQEHAVPYEMRVLEKDKFNEFLENLSYQNFLINDEVKDSLFVPPSFCKVISNSTTRFEEVMLDTQTIF